MNGLDNITFPASGVDLIQHEVRVNLYQVEDKQERLLETLKFAGRMTIEREDPFTNDTGKRQINFLVKSWVASAWSETLKQEVLYVLSQDVEQPLSQIVAEDQKADYPASIRFNVTFDVRANNQTIVQRHEGSPAGRAFHTIPPALNGDLSMAPKMFTFGDDDIIDLAIAVGDGGALALTANPAANQPKLIEFRVKPVDCNDKIGQTKASFVNLKVPQQLIQQADRPLTEIPYIRSPRLMPPTQ